MKKQRRWYPSLIMDSFMWDLSWPRLWISVGSNTPMFPIGTFMLLRGRVRNLLHHLRFLYTHEQLTSAGSLVLFKSTDVATSKRQHHVCLRQIWQSTACSRQLCSTRKGLRMMMVGCHGYSSGGGVVAPVIGRDSQSATSSSHCEKGGRNGSHASL